MKKRLADLTATGVAIILLAVLSPVLLYQTIRSKEQNDKRRY